MLPSFTPRPRLSAEPLSTEDAGRLLRGAKLLQRGGLERSGGSLLKGKKLGLLCETDESEDAALFHRAATELGAHVASIRSGAPSFGGREDIASTARLLGRLYDAIECQGLAWALVEQLSADAGIPVFDGAACGGKPLFVLAQTMEGDEALLDKRRFLLQAFLVSVIG
jgi:ornithine carbamoyltransferase